MALFGKKKLTLDEILEGIKTLSDEEKSKALASLQGEQNPEAETDVENAVENNEGEEVKDEVVEEQVDEPTEEVTEEPVAKPAVEPGEDAEGVKEPTDPQPEQADATLEQGESATDEMANDNRDEIIHQLTDKVNELSEQIKGLLELKSLMEEYTGKQAENFGYKGNILGAKKDYKDMTTEELKAHAIKGI